MGEKREPLLKNTCLRKCQKKNKSLEKNTGSTRFSLEYTPFEIPPNESAKRQNLAKEQVVDDGGFTELLFWHNQNKNYGFQKKHIKKKVFPKKYPTRTNAN